MIVVSGLIVIIVDFVGLFVLKNLVVSVFCLYCVFVYLMFGIFQKVYFCCDDMRIY